MKFYISYPVGIAGKYLVAVIRTRPMKRMKENLDDYIKRVLGKDFWRVVSYRFDHNITRDGFKLRWNGLKTKQGTPFKSEQHIRKAFATLEKMGWEIVGERTEQVQYTFYLQFRYNKDTPLHAFRKKVLVPRSSEHEPPRDFVKRHLGEDLYYITTEPNNCFSVWNDGILINSSGRRMDLRRKGNVAQKLGNLVKDGWERIEKSPFATGMTVQPINATEGAPLAVMVAPVGVFSK